MTNSTPGLPKAIKYLYSIILLLSITVSLSAQELREYSLTCNPADFTYLMEHPDEDVTVDCDFEYEGQNWQTISLTLEKNGPQSFPKKSFILHFDDTIPFLEREIVNLRAQWNDPSFCREYLAYDLLQRAGSTYPQSWFTKFYVNDVYMGLYLDVEEIDARFLARAGLSDNSSIYSAAADGCFLLPGEPIEEVWNKVTNTNLGYYDLYSLIMWLETEPYEIFFDHLSDKFQRDALARSIAANSLTGNRNTYYNNYSLIHDLSAGGVWTLVPFHMDSTFEYWSDSVEPEYFNCGHPQMSSCNALAERCWNHLEMRDLLEEHVLGMADSLFTEEYYQETAAALSALLCDAVEEDSLKQFTLNDFSEALAAIPADADSRSAVIRSQFENNPFPFNLHPPLLTPAGIYLSWDVSRTPGGSSSDYSLEIADDPEFTSGLTIIDDIAQTNVLYDSISPGHYYWRVFARFGPDLRTRSLAFFSEFDIPEGAFGGTVITGHIENSTTWDISMSPISLPQGIIVDADAVLTIEPGVLIGLGTGQSMEVYGGLNCFGSETDTIAFVPLDPSEYWGALCILEPTHEINLAYTGLTGGSYSSAGPPHQCMIFCYLGEFYMYDSYLGFAEHAGILTVGSKVQMERNRFEYVPIIPVLLQGDSAVVRDCWFSQVGMELEGTGMLELNFLEPGSHSEISRCEFYLQGDDAIDFDDAHNVNVSRNIIYAAGDKGISVSTWSDGIEVNNNIFLNCAEGIGVKTDCEVTAYNNIMAFCDIGIRVAFGNSVTGTMTSRNNVIWNNGVNIEIYPGFNFSANYSLIEESPVYPGQGNINGDPAFTDGWNGNFYPLAGSPLIDAAYGTGHPEFDLLDSARVDILSIPNTGGGDIPYVDIGVYEYYEADSTGVAVGPSIPDSFTILRNSPNPFNSVTRIEFSIDHSKWADVTIYNLLGREVFSRSFESLVPGKYSFIWDGRDFDNSSVSSGIYFCRLELQSESKVTKLVLMK